MNKQKTKHISLRTVMFEKSVLINFANVSGYRINVNNNEILLIECNSCVVSNVLSNVPILYMTACELIRKFRSDGVHIRKQTDIM